MAVADDVDEATLLRADGARDVFELLKPDIGRRLKVAIDRGGIDALLRLAG